MVRLLTTFLHILADGAQITNQTSAARPLTHTSAAPAVRASSFAQAMDG